MANGKLTDVEIKTNLAMALPGDVVETLWDMNEDPSAYYSAGVQMRVALAFRAMSEIWENSAKDMVSIHIEGGVGAQGTFEDCGVEFKNVEPTVSMILDRDAVARKVGVSKLNSTTAPDLFKESRRKGYIKAEMVRE